MKKSISTFLIIMLLFTLNGCAKKNYDPSNVERITLMRVEFFGPEYKVFVITPDYMVKQYDFTLYWINNSFDYLSDPLPPENEYDLTEWQITETSWNNMTEVLRKNRFFGLPEEIRPVRGEDFGIYYIEVAANGITHKSGGYGATDTNNRFKNAWNGIFEYLEADKSEADKRAEITGDKIVGFFFCRTGEVVTDNNYEISRDEKGFLLKSDMLYNSGIEIDENALSALQDIIVKHNIISWNGFDETVPDNMKSTANGLFAIFIAYDDNSTISARGDQAFPDGYKEAEEALVKFFDSLISS